MFKNELQFVRWLQNQNLRTGRGVRLGVGDDAALVNVEPRQELILTTDMTIEGVHFSSRLHPPQSVGHRALARSLSDIAAMGGTPRYALLSLAVSRKTSRAWIEGFYGGISALADRFHVSVIGGDTARVLDGTMIDVIVAGVVPRGQALKRTGARPGDKVFVSGRLGLSALGLQLLKARKRVGRDKGAEAIRAHLFPEPQCALGRFLAQRHLASALMDLSDGLSTDLTRLCAASGVGALLSVELLPRPEYSNAQQSVRLALHGGEDYQLLFTVPSRKVRQLPSEFHGLPLFLIGEIQPTKGVRLIGSDRKTRPVIPAGWDHFRKS